jgi:hypothetical protein
VAINTVKTHNSQDTASTSQQQAIKMQRNQNTQSQVTFSSLDRGAGDHACYLETYSVSDCLIAVHGVTKHG